MLARILICLILFYQTADAQLLINHGSIKTSNSGASPSASSFTSGHVYTGTRDMWVYIPPGYHDNADNYPLIVFGHGYGQRSTNINDVLTDGLPIYLNSGDEPPGVIIACPQDDAGDYTLADWDAVLAYMTSNYRINTNRVTITGLSGGAFWCKLVAQSRPTEIAAMVMVAGNYGSGWVWSDHVDIGHAWVHGTNDGTVTNGLSTFLSNANAVTRSTPANAFALWNLGHTGAVWNTNVYNRKERTDATGTAPWDFVRYLKKFSKNQLERATLHVECAEETEMIEDYRLAVQQVAALTASAEKTALEGRLSTLKTAIDGGGLRYIIDFGANAPTLANVTQMNAYATGTSVSNIISDEGAASVIDFSITTQFGSNLVNNGTRSTSPYFGFSSDIYNDGLRIDDAVTTGSCKFSSLPAGTYDLRIYHVQAGAASYTVETTLQVTINGVTKKQYSENNSMFYIEYTGLSPSGANEIVIQMDPEFARDVQVSAIELFKH